MKILGISGGTKNGNNDAMCKEALMGAKEVGAEVEFIQLYDLDIKHCTGCTACSITALSGKGGICTIKDDYDWLRDKMLDADGIIFSMPIFEKGASGLFHTLMDRGGPRSDRGINMIATELAEKNGGKAPDSRLLEDKVVSFMGFGGSEWTMRTQCDFTQLSLSPSWKIINNEVFPWSLSVIADDDRIAQIHQIGINLANAAKDKENAKYESEPGVCPHCHSRNFYLEGETATCCTCGIVGKIKIEDGKYSFVYGEEQEEHAHDTLSGKFIHGNDIKKQTMEKMEKAKTEKYKERQAAYKAFIQPLVPERIGDK